MKPTEMKFNELPCSVQESLLWDMELEYDGYESSKAECIHMILCGSDCSSTNESIIKNYWKALSPERLSVFLGHAEEHVTRTTDGVNRVRKMLKKA